VVGQVTMADRSAAERACKDPNPIIDGRKTNVNLAYLGAKPRTVPGRTLPGYSAITFRSKSTRVKILPLQLGGVTFWPVFLCLFLPTDIRTSGITEVFRYQKLLFSSAWLGKTIGNVRLTVRCKVCKVCLLNRLTFELELLCVGRVHSSPWIVSQGHSSRSKSMSCSCGRGNTVTRSVWPRSWTVLLVVVCVSACFFGCLSVC